jgi:hypothetical protein
MGNFVMHFGATGSDRMPKFWQHFTLGQQTGPKCGSGSRLEGSGTEFRASEDRHPRERLRLLRGGRGPFGGRECSPACAAGDRWAARRPSAQRFRLTLQPSSQRGSRKPETNSAAMAAIDVNVKKRRKWTQETRRRERCQTTLITTRSTQQASGAKITKLSPFLLHFACTMHSHI